MGNVESSSGGVRRKTSLGNGKNRNVMKRTYLGKDRNSLAVSHVTPHQGWLSLKAFEPCDD